MSSKIEWQSTKCAKCDRSMRVVDDAHKSQVTLQAAAGELKRALRCNHCGKHRCTNCKDPNSHCSCGQRIWVKVYYKEEKVTIWSRLFGR